MKLLLILGMTVALWSAALAQSTSDLVGIWSCPNFTVTIRAEGGPISFTLRRIADRANITCSGRS